MSSLPLYYALGAEAQRQGITVLFLGEGADELFGGYESYRSFSGNESDPLASLLDFYLGGSNHYYLTRLLGSKVVASLRHRLEETLKPLITGRTPKQALLAAERLLSLEPLLRRTDHALMMSGIEGRTPFLHGRIPELAMALPELELWSPRETKCALRRSYADMLPPSIISTPKRNFRAPAHSWRAEGVAALDDFVRHGKAFLAMLGLQEDGVAAVRAGCAEGDPAAIPLATGLLSISACLSKLAQEGRLASSDLNQAASEVEFIFNGIRNVRMHGESTRA
jgi:asparagine synthase (glutamine-hydrolysing)